MRCCPISRENRDLFDARIEAAAPGARSMRLDATYLAWVDFSGTGLPPEEVAASVKSRARIFASPGPQFGPGGETWLRFNFATPRPILEQALGRLDDAFSGFADGRVRAGRCAMPRAAYATRSASRRQTWTDHCRREDRRGESENRPERCRRARSVHHPEWRSLGSQPGWDER